MPDRYKCLFCGRDKFSRPYQPHRCCCGGVTKHWNKIAKMRGVKGPTFIKVDK